MVSIDGHGERERGSMMMIIRRRSFKKGEETRNACVSFFWFAVLMCVKRERERAFAFLFCFLSLSFFERRDQIETSLNIMVVSYLYTSTPLT